MIQKYNGQDQKLFNIPEKIGTKVDSYTNSPANKKSDKYSFGDSKITPNPPQSPYNLKSDRQANKFNQNNKIQNNGLAAQAQVQHSQKKAAAPANSFIQTSESQ